MLKSSHLWFVLLLLAAVAGLYGQFLWSPIVFDDLPFFMADSGGHQPVDDYRYSPFELRSLPYASLAWGKALFGLDMLHFRVENLLLHAAVAVALYFFLSHLLGAVYGARRDSLLSPRALAFSAALLFALHPVAVYAAGYLVQRTMLMATLFSVLAMHAYLHGSRQDDARWLWASVLFYYLAVFSKEHAVMLPVVLLALTLLLHEDGRTRLLHRWPLFAAYAAVALFAVAAKQGVLGSAYEIYAAEMLPADGGAGEGGSNYLLSVLTQSWLFFKYLALWLFPNPNWMSADMREPFAASLYSGYALALLAFLAWGVAAVHLLLKRGRAGLLGFVMLFPWLMFMTEFSTIRIQESFVLYRSYLWAAGVCAIVPFLLDWASKRMAAVVVVAIALAMFPISMDRLASFAHPLLLWDDAEKLVRDRQDLPGVYRIYYNRGTEFIQLGEYDRAIQDLAVAARLNPDWPFPHSNLGAAYGQTGRWQESVAAFTHAIEAAERKKLGVNARPYYGRAMSYERLGMMEQARQDYAVSCRIEKMGCEKLK